MNDDREIWRDIPGKPGFQASSFGCIRFLTVEGNFVIRHYKGRGAPTLGTKRVSVAHLVLVSFAGQPPNEDSVARHLDDNLSNNRLNNLAWGSQSDNAYDAKRNGKFLGWPVGKSPSTEHRNSISSTMGRKKWITNGFACLRVDADEPLEIGWRLGRLTPWQQEKKK